MRTVLSGKGNVILRRCLPRNFDKGIFSRFKTTMERLRGKRIAVVCGGLPDADSLGAAYAISGILGGNARVAIASSKTTGIEGICSKLDLDVADLLILRELKPESWNGLVLLDASEASSTKGIGRWIGKIDMIIDHHGGDLIESELPIVVGAMPSTCSIVASLLDDKLIDGRIATALATGHALDLGIGARPDIVLGHLSKRSGLGLQMIQRLAFRELQPQVEAEINRVLETAVANELNLINGGKLLVVSLQRQAPDRDFASMIADQILRQGHLGITPDVVCVMGRVKGSGNVKISLRAKEEVGVDLHPIAKEICSGRGGGRPKVAGGVFSGRRRRVIGRLQRLVSGELEAA